MCLAKAYAKEKMAEPILENIISMQFDGYGIRMQTMFGEEKLIPGKVLEIDFEASKVIVDLHNSVAAADTPKEIAG